MPVKAKPKAGPEGLQLALLLQQTVKLAYAVNGEPPAPKFNSNQSRVAYEFAVATTIASAAEKRKEKAKNELLATFTEEVGAVSEGDPKVSIFSNPQVNIDLHHVSGGRKTVGVVEMASAISKKFGVTMQVASTFVLDELTVAASGQKRFSATFKE